MTEGHRGICISYDYRQPNYQTYPLDFAFCPDNTALNGNDFVHNNVLIHPSFNLASPPIPTVR
ncbi:hypothetical protein DSUL_80044 [Desulfovibrionales bacterium]